MPNIKSAAKRLRQSEKRRAKNRSVKSELRTLIRRVREALADKSLEKAQEAYRPMAQKLDRAGSRRVIHPNRAARIKSRLQKQIKALKSPSPAA